MYAAARAGVLDRIGMTALGLTKKLGEQVTAPIPYATQIC